MHHVALCLAAIACGCAARATYADDLTIATDRPGILYGTEVVPVGRVQVEAGVPTWQRSDSNGERDTLITTPTSLRIGVSDAFEFQIVSSPFDRDRMHGAAGDDSVSGSGDLQLGAKWLLRTTDAHGPRFALIGYVSLPTGSRAFTAGRPGYNLNLVGNWNLADDTNFGAMLGATHMPIASGGHADSGIVAVNLSRSFSDRLGGYVETGWFPGFRNAQSTALAGAGVTWLVTNRFQIDGFFDRGLNKDSPDWALGTGASVLF